LARAPVSKTGGWGFETLHPCHGAPLLGPALFHLPPAKVRKEIVLAFAPIKFLRDVRFEAGRVTWPSRRETGITTVMVIIMAVLVAIFFVLVDQVIGAAIRWAFGTV
jgi:preprotein translocase subunit SecE